MGCASSSAPHPHPGIAPSNSTVERAYDEAIAKGEAAAANARAKPHVIIDSDDEESPVRAKVATVWVRHELQISEGRTNGWEIDMDDMDSLRLQISAADPAVLSAGVQIGDQIVEFGKLQLPDEFPANLTSCNQSSVLPAEMRQAFERFPESQTLSAAETQKLISAGMEEGRMAFVEGLFQLLLTRWLDALLSWKRSGGALRMVVLRPEAEGTAVADAPASARLSVEAGCSVPPATPAAVTPAPATAAALLTPGLLQEVHGVMTPGTTAMAQAHLEAANAANAVASDAAEAPAEPAEEAAAADAESEANAAPAVASDAAEAPAEPAEDAPTDAGAAEGAVADEAAAAAGAPAAAAE